MQAIYESFARFDPFNGEANLCLYVHCSPHCTAGSRNFQDSVTDSPIPLTSYLPQEITRDHTRRTTNIGRIIYLSPSSLPLSGLVDGSHTGKIYPLLPFYDLSWKWGGGEGGWLWVGCLFYLYLIRKVRALLKKFFWESCNFKIQNYSSSLPLLGNIVWKTTVQSLEHIKEWVSLGLAAQSIIMYINTLSVRKTISRD
jgi:hypothetical protein